MFSTRVKVLALPGLISQQLTGLLALVTLSSSAADLANTASMSQ
ncbi:hypothetical protein [Xanthomonas fragariae]|nr:hypothetical protein [Xanthomonas fragariae]